MITEQQRERAILKDIAALESLWQAVLKRQPTPDERVAYFLGRIDQAHWTCVGRSIGNNENKK